MEPNAGLSGTGHLLLPILCLCFFKKKPSWTHGNNYNQAFFVVCLKIPVDSEIKNDNREKGSKRSCKKIDKLELYFRALLLGMRKLTSQPIFQNESRILGCI